MRIVRFLLTLLVMTLALLAVGCSYPVRNTGFLRDYTSFDTVDEKQVKLRLAAKEDHSVDHYFPTKEQIEEKKKRGEPIPDAKADNVSTATVQCVLFVVEKPEWKSATRLKTPELEEEVLFTVRERIYRYLLRQYPHPVRVRYAYTADDPLVRGYRILHIDSAVTDIKAGNGTARFMIGYGVGATVLQFEGRITEGEKRDKPVAEFAVRESHGGYPNGFINTEVFKPHYCLKYAAEEGIGKLATEIRKAIPAARPREGFVVPPPPAPKAKKS